MEVQVKRSLCRVRDPSTGTIWGINETGSTRHYLFRAFDRSGLFLTGLEIPAKTLERRGRPAVR